MTIAFQSSFLRDIQRIDNTIYIETCEIAYQSGRAYSGTIDTVNVTAIYDKSNKKLRLYFETPTFSGGYKVYFNKLKFYYRVGREDETIRGISEAFTISRAGNELLDSFKNLIELNMNFQVDLISTSYGFTAEDTLNIKSSTFDTLGLDDTLTLGVSGRYTVKTYNDDILPVTSGVISQEKLRENIGIIKSRGLYFSKTVSGATTIRHIYITYKEPVKAAIKSKYNDLDTTFLQGPGYSITQCSGLYRNTQLTPEDYVYTDSYRKYTASEGIKVSGDAEVLEIGTGELTTGRRRFRSYKNIVIDPGNWIEETREEDVEIEEKITEDIGTENFNRYDSPLEDSTLQEENQECTLALDEYLNPGGLLYGNTSCYLYRVFDAEEFGGLVFEGTPGTRIQALYNQAYENGPYSTQETIIGEDGKGSMEKPELPFFHLNSVRVLDPCKISSILVVMIEKRVETKEIPVGQTYTINIKKTGADVKVYGTVEYTEYEEYLGKITQVSKGKVSIDSVPELKIVAVENMELDYTIDYFFNVISCGEVNIASVLNPYAIFRLVVENNKIYEDGNIYTSDLYSEYKIRIDQEGSGVIWKLGPGADYIENGRNLYVLDSASGSEKIIQILTTFPYQSFDYHKLTYKYIDLIGNIFTFTTNPTSVELTQIELDDGTLVEGTSVTFTVRTRSANNGNTWRPSIDGDPILTDIYYGTAKLSSCSFYTVQRPYVRTLEIWENVYGNYYSPVKDNRIYLYDDFRKFVVVSREQTEKTIWYYSNITGTNKFTIHTNEDDELTDKGALLVHTGSQESISVTDNDYIRRIVKNNGVSDSNLGVIVAATNPDVLVNWREAVISDMVSADVIKNTFTVYLRIGTSESNVQEANLNMTVTRIKKYDLYVKTNYHFYLNTYGYAYVIGSDGKTLGDYYQYVNPTPGTDVSFSIPIAFSKFDEDTAFGNSKIYLYYRTTRLTVNFVKGTIEKYHNYVTTSPKRFRFIGNGGVSTSGNFYFTSSTTPNTTVENASSGIKYTITTSNSIFNNFDYYRHYSSIAISNIPGSLSKVRYPIQSFIEFAERSLSYSQDETVGAPGTTVSPLYLDYFVRGLEHYLFYSESLSNFSQAIMGDNNSIIVYAKAAPGNPTSFYILSRYNEMTIGGNSTFTATIPSDLTVTRAGYTTTIDVGSWAKLGSPDSETGLEYYVPIEVSTTKPNTGGNLYLGEITFTANTKIVQSSITNHEILSSDISSDVLADEGVTVSYIINNIIGNSARNLTLKIYLYGTNETIFQNVNNLDSWYDVSRNEIEIVFETGTKVGNINESSITASNNFENPTYNPGLNSLTTALQNRFYPEYPNTQTPSYEYVSTGYWLEADNYYSNDVSGNLDEEHYNYYRIQNSMYSYCLDTGTLNLGLSVNYTIDNQPTPDTPSYTYNGTCRQYGYHEGFIIKGISGTTNTTTYYGIGVGGRDNYSSYRNTLSEVAYYIGKDGGTIKFNTGIVIFGDGSDADKPSAGATLYRPNIELISPSEVTTGFNVTWNNGAVGNTANMTVTIPENPIPPIGQQGHDRIYFIYFSTPSTRTKAYTWYPSGLFIKIAQEKNEEYLNFTESSLNIYSNGVPYTNTIGFTSNLSAERFQNVTFDSTLSGFNTSKITVSYNSSTGQGTITFNSGKIFNENHSGSRITNKEFRAKIKIFSDYEVIARIPLYQGHFSLPITPFYHPYDLSTIDYSNIINHLNIKPPYTGAQYQPSTDQQYIIGYQYRSNETGISSLSGYDDLHINFPDKSRDFSILIQTEDSTKSIDVSNRKEIYFNKYLVDKGETAFFNKTIGIINIFITLKDDGGVGVPVTQESSLVIELVEYNRTPNELGKPSYSTSYYAGVTTPTSGIGTYSVPCKTEKDSGTDPIVLNSAAPRRAMILGYKSNNYYNCEEPIGPGYSNFNHIHFSVSDLIDNIITGVSGTWSNYSSSVYTSTRLDYVYTSSGNDFYGDQIPYVEATYTADENTQHSEARINVSVTTINSYLPTTETVTFLFYYTIYTVKL